jgi:hypothetical protein
MDTAHRPDTKNPDPRAGDPRATGTHQTTERRFDREREPTYDDRSLGQLIKEFRDETTSLFRKEIALARTEMSEKVSRLSRNVAYLIAGALVAFAGLVVLLIAAGAAVSAALIAAGMEVNALWLGPLIVGFLVTFVGALMVIKGKNTLQKESLVPEKTAESLKENKEWVTQKAT